MSTVGKRDFRPKIHFTPPKMWTNDPNGLVYANGKYHLFYQHHPEDTVWGPMHWGHAVSTDLIHWEHLPIALCPDELGTIFSGSAVFDSENTSGFGTPENPPIVAMYTQDYQAEGIHCQHQSIAYTLDGVHFTKYSGNPVIPCPEGRVDFRDPKIFRNRIRNCWGMVLAAGDHVEFFASQDLIHWEKTGEFGPAGNCAPGVWECPDLFELPTPTGTRYVLLVSMGMDVQQGGSRTQYFVGFFDGETFRPERVESAPLWLDEGFENYAGVTFDNTDSRILIGWANSWPYAPQCPTGDFCGSMTLPRRLSLRETPMGLRLACNPIGLEPYLDPVQEIASGDPLPGETFALSVKGSGDGEISLENSDGQILRFGIRDNVFFFDRSHGGDVSFSDVFASGSYSRREVPRIFSGDWNLEVVFDVSQIELFLDGGVQSMSCLVFPDTPYTRLSLDAPTVSKPRIAEIPIRKNTQSHKAKP